MEGCGKFFKIGNLELPRFNPKNEEVADNF